MPILATATVLIEGRGCALLPELQCKVSYGEGAT